MISVRLRRRKQILDCSSNGVLLVVRILSKEHLSLLEKQWFPISGLP